MSSWTLCALFCKQYAPASNRTMNVALHADRLFRSAPTGIGVYTDRLLQYAPQVAPDDSFFAVALPEQGNTRPLGVPARTLPVPRRVGMVTQTAFGWPRIESAVGEADLVHTLTTTPVATRLPRVQTIHDLTPQLFPDQYSKLHRRLSSKSLRRAVKGGAHLIAISEHTAGDLMRLTGVGSDRITVVLLGYDAPAEAPPKAEQRAAVRQSFGLTGPFVMFTGALTRRKNLVFLIDAFARLRRRQPEVQLVLAGRPGLGAEEIDAAIRHHGLDQAVLRPGYVSDRDLTTLLFEASAFAFPSHYEGFGIPPLDAMAHGTPVVACPGGAVQEVVGDAALVVSPENPSQFADALASVLTDAAEADRLRAAGYERIRTFSWRRMARETVDVYHHVAR